MNALIYVQPITTILDAQARPLFAPHRVVRVL